MSTFKKVKVVMLTTNQKANGTICKDITEKDRMINIKSNGLMEHEDYIGQHLYIISDDEIKENNTHFYNPHSGQLHISGNHTDYEAINKNGCKKIIATTDTSLFIETELNAYYRNGIGGAKRLPRPSRQFIEKYIEEYNKGNVITDVMIEYDTHPTIRKIIDNVAYPGMDIEFLKINPKDNTITIKKAKDSWTREEHISNIKKFSLELGLKIHCFLKEDGTLSISIQDVNKGIEENL